MWIADTTWGRRFSFNLAPLRWPRSLGPRELTAIRAMDSPSAESEQGTELGMGRNTGRDRPVRPSSGSCHAELSNPRC